MKVAIIQFPGSNCDQDALWALRNDLEIECEYVWHNNESLRGFDAVFVPGGFSFGDYLRCGAMAARSPIMSQVVQFANDGLPVIGVCNGFQVLCEAGLLPGALLLNGNQKFLCQDVYLRSENSQSFWTRNVDRILRVPIAHGEGRYVCDEKTMADITENDQIAFRYCTSEGEFNANSNPNQSQFCIAGVLNRAGNVLGMMPHPERATSPHIGGTDGLLILKSLQMVNSVSI